ncbi:type II toxin-antitoxin system HipA family toxin [Lysobacter sp. H23M47]|uniref:type II toxin-antitoxin system HipA family toxin n=1 Tax=Lysobacter sp. H23M47 TaxID=2781024 RepID=UPI00187E1894|nr:type II toxin-antitoxin system HipA family toxin [Lysobacter sp. H23M47]QOW24034.1 type II toxin-antitoxin system HipA family toxin [Lysobacter sp. H23M47]
MKKLSVIYAGWGERYVLGHLGDDGTQVLFEYSPVALQQGLELSPLRLPLREQAYGGFPGYQLYLPGLIADALPDGWGMLLMDRIFRREGRNPARISALDRLAFIGDTAMGALSFEPPSEGELEPADVQLIELAMRVREVQSATGTESGDVLRELALLGGSPQGARPKVLVNFDPASGHMSNSEQGSGTPWLVKFQAGNEHKEVCAIEALYARLAAACGIQMPASHYFDLDSNLAAFGVDRFDREDGMRVPMHTAAGALDMDFRMPSLDYTTLLRLTRFMTRDEREVAKGYARCVFNVVFNNRDDHAKNFSFRLRQDRQWTVSPAYDLTFNEGPRGEHQTDICGEGRAPTRKDLLRLADEAGIDTREALDIIARCVDVAGHFKVMAGEFPVRTGTVDHITGRIEANRRRM